MTNQQLKSLSFSLTINSTDASELLVFYVNELIIWC